MLAEGALVELMKPETLAFFAKLELAESVKGHFERFFASVMEMVLAVKPRGKDDEQIRAFLKFHLILFKQLFDQGIENKQSFSGSLTLLADHLHDPTLPIVARRAVKIFASLITSVLRCWANY